MQVCRRRKLFVSMYVYIYISLYLRYLLAAKEKGKQDLSVQCLLKLMICAHKTDNAGKVIRAPNYIQGCGSLDHGVGVQEEELLVRAKRPHRRRHQTLRLVTLLADVLHGLKAEDTRGGRLLVLGLCGIKLSSNLS